MHEDGVSKAHVWQLYFLFGNTCTKIGKIQRRLAWPLRKDDTLNREAFQMFSFLGGGGGRVGLLFTSKAGPLKVPVIPNSMY